MRVAILACMLGCALIGAQPGVFLDVPFVAQPKDGCGAAVISMLMQYWNREAGAVAPASVESIQAQLFSAKDRGILASDLEHYLKQQQYQTFALKGEWKDVQDHLAKGRPMIVALEPSRGDLHYVVVTGYDAADDIIVKNDPAARKAVKQRRREFLEQWKAAGYWILLAVPSSAR